ncbi:TetR/AcrR family transcriptional regulator [Streptomyces sp. NBC_01353]|uniref:TetR/AcrR family transcriptional regulator n=1 Tax=Streptomyces sp. NBC_01353 TaxID=2903835 RepID=UPI002E37203E|nr:TetR family transcriptional regulator [Streptomyces sp. NBC_01353]
MAADPTPPPSLRERKKLRTRAAIRKATYRLVAEQGYEAATVERIAAAADVSPSTVVRYFPVKEDILLTDESDAVLDARLRARPADEEPLESLRAVVLDAVATAFADEPEETRLRARVMVEVPAVRARLTETAAETAQLLARALAERTGREPDDLEVRVFTAAVLGALREATVYWAERGQTDDLVRLLDRTVDTLKGGLSLRALP